MCTEKLRYTCTIPNLGTGHNIRTIRWMGDWVNSKAHVDEVEKILMSPCREPNPVNPVA
jgi:hypothetical protein